MPAEASAPGREPVAFATENNVHLLNFKEEWYCAVVIIDVADIDVAEGSTEVNMMHRPLTNKSYFSMRRPSQQCFCCLRVRARFQYITI